MGKLFKLKLVLVPVGLVALAVLGVLTALKDAPVQQPALYAPIDFRTSNLGVIADNKANEENAESAPQQQVTSLWAIRDFSALILSQGDETNKSLSAVNANLGTLLKTPVDDRSVKLLALLLVAVAWLGMWSVVAKPNPEGASLHAIAGPTDTRASDIETPMFAPPVNASDTHQTS